MGTPLFVLKDRDGCRSGLFKLQKEFTVTSKNSIFKNLVATLRAGSSFKVANTESIRHFSFLPSLGLTQIFLTKAIFRGDLTYPVDQDRYATP